MKKLIIGMTLAVIVVAGVTVPTSAIPQSTERGASPGNFGPSVDVDGDGIDDSLAAQVDAAAPNEQFDVILTFRGRADEAAIRRAVGPFETSARFSIIDGFAATMTAAQIRGLAHTPGVFRIEADSTASTTVDAADADFGTEAARATYGVDGNGVGICIVDTGVDPTHEQLDNGKVVAFTDLVNGQTTAYDDHGHGTHVASIAVGDGDGASVDAAVFGGVAPGASLYAAKALDAQGSGAESDVVLGIEWCTGQPGVHIVSLSLGVAEGSDGADALSQAVDNAVTVAGRAVTVAAGNSGDGTETILSPGVAQHAITVGAVAEYSAPPGTVRHSSGIHLAGFSSRGPTLAGLTKPNITAPGVSITAAAGNSGDGYTTFSGTSMATPFVAGTLALALERNSGLSPAALKQLVMDTAQDRGEPGTDVNWGAGLLDGLAVVSAANGGPALPVAFPRNEFGSGQVNRNGVFTHTFSLSADDLSTPIGITLLIEGQAECARLFGVCLGIYEWAPDLDAELRDPTGTVIASSLCPGDPSGHCGSLYVTMGQQETLAAMPTVAGTYELRVNPVSAGGRFSFDISAGAPGGSSSGVPPIADAGIDQTVTDADDDGTEAVTLDGTGSSDPDGGAIDTYSWDDGNGSTWPGPSPTITLPVGTHTITLTVTDDEADTASDIVVVTVIPSEGLPPIANAGADQVVFDDGEGTVTVTLNGSGSDPDGGNIGGYAWAEGTTALGSGASIDVDLTVGLHTITLTVTDDEGDTGTDTVDVLVLDPIDASHVHDLDASAVSVGRNRWEATVEVFVVGLLTENLGLPVGVDPSLVTFSVSTGGTLTCMSPDDGPGDNDGWCSVTTSTLRKRDKSVTLTLTDVSTPGFSYDPTANHDADGDSDGTSITIQRP